MRPSHFRRLPLVAVSAVLALIWLAPGALAYWSNAGEGSASASLATLSPPTISSATAGAETVELAWSAVTPPGAGTVQYYVTRDGGPPGGGCPSSSSGSTLTSCTDTGVSIGTHEYTVTAVWRSWTATSAAKSATITSGPATHLQLEAASTTPTAGEADKLTITAKDASNNTVGSYTGSHSLVLEGATEAPSGTKPVVIDRTGVERKLTEPTEITFTEGRATVSSARNGVMKLYRSEEAHITVKEGSLNNGAGLAVKVTPGAFNSFLVVQSPSEPEAGSAFEVKLTALDEWHNTMTSYTRTTKLHYEGAEASPSGKAAEYPATTEPTFSAGEATVTGFKLYGAASTTLTVKEEVSGHEGSAAFTVKPGPFKSFHVVPSPAEPEAGGAFEVKLTAGDEWHNTISSYTRTNKLNYEGAEASPSGQAAEYSANTEPTFSGGEATVTGLTFYDAASTTLTVKEEISGHGGAGIFTVKPGPAESLAWTGATVSAGTLSSPCLFTCEDTTLEHSHTFKSGVSVTDEYGNIVSGLGTGHTVKITKTAGKLSTTELTIPSAGAATSTSEFTFTSQASGAGTDTLKAKTKAGRIYAEAEARLHY